MENASYCKIWNEQLIQPNFSVLWQVLMMYFYIMVKPIHNIKITIIKETEIYTNHFTCYKVSWLALGGVQWRSQTRAY